jgi:hypothetical protein
MMIFDTFPTRERAVAFAAAVADRLGLTAAVRGSDDGADAPAVQVERPRGAREFEVELLALGYGGRVAVAGT